MLYRNQSTTRRPKRQDPCPTCYRKKYTVASQCKACYQKQCRASHKAENKEARRIEYLWATAQFARLEAESATIPGPIYYRKAGELERRREFMSLRVLRHPCLDLCGNLGGGGRSGLGVGTGASTKPHSPGSQTPPDPSKVVCGVVSDKRRSVTFGRSTTGNEY